MERETVTKFDLEAAFKALDEIACPDVSGKGRFTPNRINLKERLQAKHAHEVLVEDYFDVSMEEDLNEAQEQREAEVAKAKLARIEKIVDLDAESEEDILPSYVGKVIMQCPQCMTLFYKNEEDIEKSEETPDVVNINEICQHCGNSSGYTLVGKVGEVAESEMSDFEGGDELATEEGGEDELNLDFPEEGTEEVDAEGTGEGADEMSLDLSDEDLAGIDSLDGEDAEEEEETNESLNNSKMLADIEKKNELKTDIESEHLTLNEDTELASGNGIPKEPADALSIYIDKSGSGAQAYRAEPMVKDFIDQHPDVWVNVYYFTDSRYSEPLAAAKAGKQVIVYTDDDYTTNCPELADFENVTLINVMQESLKEDLADWYRKKFDKPASTETQQAWEDELNGEFGEISDERRKHLERKFAQQRDWEARHANDAGAASNAQAGAVPSGEAGTAVAGVTTNAVDELEELPALESIDKEELTEGFSVKYGRGAESKEFDNLEDAVKHINDGMKNRDHDAFVLYQDGEEMIWLDWYTANRDGSDSSWSEARSTSKSPVVFDRKTGTLSIKPAEETKEAKNMRIIVAQEVAKNGKVGIGQKLLKFFCIMDESQPSHLDVAAGKMYYNKKEVLGEVCDKFVAELEGGVKNESLEEVEEGIFGFGKKKGSGVNHYIGAMGVDRSRTLYTAEISKKFERAIKAHATNVTRSNRNYFMDHKLAQFEFDCTENDLRAIKNDLYDLRLDYDRYMSSAGRTYRYRNGHAEFDSEAKEAIANLFEFRKLGSVSESLEESTDIRIFVDQSGSLIDRKDEIMARVAADYPGSENQVEFFDDAECAGPRASAEAGQNVVVYTNGDCEANCPDLCKIATIKNIDAAEASVEESLEGETELTEDAEMDELLDELWDGPQPTDAEIEADLAIMSQEAEDEEVFEEFDDRFDTQVTEYLEDVYSNVDKYESTECSADNKKLIVEGKITFKSGKSKSTKFVFESAKRIGDKIVYRGVNEDLAGAARAFRMTCKAEGTKLVTENFKYSYKINESFIRGSKR